MSNFILIFGLFNLTLPKINEKKFNNSKNTFKNICPILFFEKISRSGFTNSHFNRFLSRFDNEIIFFVSST